MKQPQEAVFLAFLAYTEIDSPIGPVIVSSDASGDLVGYGGGLPTKVHLLDLEQRTLLTRSSTTTTCGVNPMKYVHLDSVESGQYLGRTIYASNGAILLSENVQLTVFMINTLNRIGVTMIYIKDPNLEDVEIPEILSDETKRLVMTQMGQTFAAIQSGKEFNSRICQHVD